MGGVLSMTSKIFEKLNGYPNNMRGWGGEDDSLLIRMAETGHHTLGYPKKGSVIDLEEDSLGKTIGLREKLKKLENNQVVDLLKLEKLMLDIDHWKENGLNSLVYKINDRKKLNQISSQIVVDLCYEKEEKSYPLFYPKGQEFKNKNNYKQFKKKIYQTLHHYYGQIQIKEM